jgi:NodT family efflux transporter outer membrane factor (OMF) lipoprotein
VPAPKEIKMGLPVKRAIQRKLLLLTALPLLTACAVGPDYEKPASPAVSGYIAKPLATTAASPNVVGGNAQSFASGADIAADWWTLFHSQPLSDLIAQALANNHDLKAARAALTVAHENALAGRGAYYPKLTAGFTATREQDPPGALAPVPSDNAFLYNLFTPQLSISYMPDVFGLTRRTVESLDAQSEGVRFQMAAAYNTLVNNVVVTVIQDTSVRLQIEATRQQIDLDTKSVEILQRQHDDGYASGADLAAQKALLAQTQATLPALIKQSAQLEDQLAVLTGQFPSQASIQQIDLANLQLPDQLPLSLPSALVAQRPDVLQAEANMKSANALIGVAIANRLPNLTLTGNAGSEALQIGQLFGPGTGFWNIGAAFAATIFDGNALLHQERGARAAYIQAAEQYRSAVLGAFQNVADTLVALQQDAEGLKAASAAADAAKTTLDITQRQLQDGYAGSLALLNAEQTYQQARINLVQAQATRYADTAALFQALGGGWWHRAELSGDKDEN